MGELSGMAVAKRRFLPGYLWHITHRRHKKKLRKGAPEIFGIGKQDIQPNYQPEDWTKVVVLVADIFLISTDFDIMV
jgi:hypothetical protein